MDGIFQWIKNITYYLIFISLISNLMPNGKYERYIKLFSGAVFLLIAAGPLTGGLKLDEKLAYAYQQIQFVQDTREFEKQLWGMEAERMGRIIRQYEEAVAQDVRAMAEADGYRCVEASVQIEGDAESSQFGQVTAIEMVLERGDNDEWMAVGSGDVEAEAFLEKEAGAGEGGNQTGGRTAVEPVEGIQVQVDAGSREDSSEIGHGKHGGAGVDPEAGTDQKREKNEVQSRARRARAQKEQEELYGFQRKVAGYYGLEETDIRITQQDDEGKLDYSAVPGIDPYDSSNAVGKSGG